MDTANEPVITFTVDPESELGRALQQLDESPIVLECNGARYRVTRADEDLESEYDPERFRAALRAVAGTLTPEEGERRKELIYQARDGGSRPSDRPKSI